VQRPQQTLQTRKGGRLQSGAECKHAGHIVHSGSGYVQKVALYSLWLRTLANQRDVRLLVPVTAPPQGPCSCALPSENGLGRTVGHTPRT